MDEHTPCQRCGATFGPEPTFDRFWNEWRQKCGHCGLEMAVSAPVDVEESPDEIVYFVLVECPKCHETDCPVVSSPLPTRKHKCRSCGHAFKSTEAKLSDIFNDLKSRVQNLYRKGSNGG
jgi:transcription elongation factor Elf1